MQLTKIPDDADTNADYNERVHKYKEQVFTTEEESNTSEYQ